jgi:hypothetical protein
MHPKNISIRDYTYDLSEEKIARYPKEMLPNFLFIKRVK